jgi:sirohydrochlorin ferrochelatase
MRRALLIVDHGSGRPEAHEHLERIAARVSELAPDWVVRVAHMELASPSIEAGIEACVSDGADEVSIHPLFLVPGRHLTEDIPGLVRDAARRHPHVQIRITESLGASPGLPALILQAASARSASRRGTGSGTRS